MNKTALLDNDVIIKVCSFGLARESISAIESVGSASVITAIRFVVAKQIQKKKNLVNKDAVLTEFNWMTSVLNFIEPTASEVSLASQLEEIAQKHQLPLDGGESLLLAVMITRTCSIMLTGDKRAIRALEALLSLQAPEELQSCKAKVACLEQLILTMLEHASVHEIRTKICQCHSADVALANCFSCTASTIETTSIRQGLVSYIGSLRTEAPSVLWPTSLLGLTSVEPHTVPLAWRRGL